MESYNTKVLELASQFQVKHYMRPIRTGFELSADDKLARKRHTIADDDRIETQKAHSLSCSRNRTINKVYGYALSNKWEWFLTFTFDPKKIDSTDYDKVVGSLSEWLHQTRKAYAPDIGYLIVPELHKDGRKYHFHGLFRNIGTLPIVDSGHCDAAGNRIFNLPSYGFGFTTCSIIRDSDKACSYLLKYITKELCATTLNRKRYWHSRNLAKPVETPLNVLADDWHDFIEQFPMDVARVKTIDIDKAFNKVSIYNLYDDDSIVREGGSHE